MNQQLYVFGNMKNISERISEAKAKEFSIYFSYEHDSLAVHQYGDTNDDDKTGFKTIDEAVKAIYKKNKDAHINIIPSDKLVEYMK